MILGSHNAWSYLPINEWWLKPFNFIAKCQEVDIKTQYEKFNVKCFDLRLKFNKKGRLKIVHGLVSYKYTYDQLIQDLEYINRKGDCSVRILHDVRNKWDKSNVEKFREYCSKFEEMFKNIKFWCGKDLYKYKIQYKFDYEPKCVEAYSSVTKPFFDYPKLYANWNNIINIAIGNITEKSNTILLIDYVNI